MQTQPSTGSNQITQFQPAHCSAGGYLRPRTGFSHRRRSPTLFFRRIGAPRSAILLLIILTTLSFYLPVTAQDPRSELIAMINGLRTSYGLPPYTVDPGLMAMAQEHSQYQATIHRSTHQHSDGRTPSDLGVIENVAGGTYGYVTPHIVVYNIWVDPGHLHTMIGYPSGAIGVGVADDGVNTYYTLELRPSGAALSSPQAAGTAQANFTPIPLVALTTVTPLANGAVYHLVGYGQTLWALAQAYGVTVDQLRAWNNLPADSSEIYAGQKLLVRLAQSPAATSTVEVIAPVGQASVSTEPPAAASTAPPISSPTLPSAGTVSPAPGSPSFVSEPPQGSAIPQRSTPQPKASTVGVIGGLLILAGFLLVLIARGWNRK